ncbi:MAG: PA0069 family radical SAM protein [Gemmobacter sp.]
MVTVRSPSLPPGTVLRARGAGTNAAGRFERHSVEPVHDDLDPDSGETLLRTEVRTERPRSALAYNASPDLPFDRSVNPYRGCEHGCSYCFARPTHAFLGLSPGLDFETRLIARPGIARVLEAELARPGYRVAPVAIGTNTDPYQPIEAQHGLMREILSVLAAHRHPVAITTKGTLVERDIDLIAPMAADGIARVGISVTTLDPALSRRLEPRAPLPARRLRVIERLSAAGIEVRVMVAPVIPGLTDHELEPILKAAHEAGAVAASWILLRLPLEVAPLFRDWLATHAPQRAGRVLGRLRQMRGGSDYDAEWFRRMTGQGVWSDLLHRRFETACARLGLARRLAPLRSDLFRVPPRAGEQLSLFG